MKNLPINIPKLPSSSSANNFSSKPRTGITSIARQTGRTSAFRQFGDAVSHNQNNQRSGKIFGSINRAIKSKASDSDLPNNPSGSKPNQNYKPIIR